jgi:hypothetical protein
MTAGRWPAVTTGRLGAGVLLEADILIALRNTDHPAHDRVARRALALAESGLPLVVSYLSLAQAASVHYAAGDAEGAGRLLASCRETFNVVLPEERDIAAAEELLGQGVERLTLEQAVTGAMASRLGCSVYGSSPAYHLFRVAVVVD